MESVSRRYIDGAYLQQNPTWDVEDSPWKAEIIFELLKKQPGPLTDITEVGCGAGGILESLALKLPDVQQFRGYDISPQAISLAKKNASGRVAFSQDDFTENTSLPAANVLLLIDVLEHVGDYYGFLEKLRSRSTYFVFHIPLDLSCRTLLKPHVLLQQRDAVGHLHYFSEEMVWWFLKDTGYTVLDWVYTKPITDIRKPGSFRQGVKKHLRNFSFSLNRKISAKLWGGYSLMILAR